MRAYLQFIRPCSKHPVAFLPGWRTHTLILFCSIAMSSLDASEYESGSFSFSLGMDYSSGDYGLAADTEMLYLPATLEYSQFPWRLAITIPYLRITGPGGVIGGNGGGIIVKDDTDRRSNRGGSGGETPTLRTQQGLADIVTSLSYALDPLWNLPYAVDLIGEAKLATADAEKELGSGSNDYSLQLNMAATQGRLTPFFTLGYRLMGDLPQMELSNVSFASLGLDYRLSHSLYSGISFDYRQAYSATAAELREWVAYLNWEMDNSWSINGYGVAGFSNASPDAAVGIQLRYAR